MSDEVQGLERKKNMADVWVIIGVVVAWIVLNRWLLPRLGVPT
jgi:hypothetical protein